MRNVKNETHIEGWLYDHALEQKVTGDTSKHPGTPFINGTVSIATDDEMLNIVQVHYSYSTALTSKGKPNASHDILAGIIDGTYKTVMKDGKDNATKMRIDSAVGLNEFYSDRNNPGNPELVSTKRNEGGFIHVITDKMNEDPKQRNTFKCDMLIIGTKKLEEDEERGLPERLEVNGFIFDFRKALLPVKFVAQNPNAIAYFEGLNASKREPVFTNVWGRQVSQTVVKRIVEESAFGEDSVRETTSTRKEFIITGAAKEPYEWDSEETMTVVELKEALANRETYLATVKQRQEEYQANRNNAITPAPTKDDDGFNF